MRIKALITALVLGSTIAGVASAAPLVRDHRYEPVIQQPVVKASVSTQPYGFQVDRDGDRATPYAYGQDPNVEYTPRSSWQLITQEAHLNGRGYATFDLGAQQANVLELQAQDHNKLLDIDRVSVLLKDGRTVNINPDRQLDRTHSPNLRLDLGESARCGIAKVTVYGQGGGGFKLLAA